MELSKNPETLLIQMSELASFLENTTYRSLSGQVDAAITSIRLPFTNEWDSKATAISLIRGQERLCDVFHELWRKGCKSAINIWIDLLMPLNLMITSASEVVWKEEPGYRLPAWYSTQHLRMQYGIGINSLNGHSNT